MFPASGASRRLGGFYNTSDPSRHEGGPGIIERVLFLEGLPNLQEPPSRLAWSAGGSGRQMPEARPALRTWCLAYALLVEAVALAEVESDLRQPVTCSRSCRKPAREAIDWLETQLNLIDVVTLPDTCVP